MATDKTIFSADKIRFQVAVEHEKVTWVKILQWERGMNAQDGGWNSCTYWVDRGLNWIAGEGLKEGAENSPVELWTKASVGKEAEPEPRKNEFKLIRKAEKNTRSPEAAVG
ncbi:MAG: hypothetical protein CMJ64_07710 [Planctomycetaceae bacterium]|nr:hypothetical protein [Planctomycetaceae bacterium]